MLENRNTIGNVSGGKGKKIEKGLKKLVIIAGIIFAAQLIWLFGISPFIPFSVIEVEGFEGLNREEILSLAGITETSSFVSSDIKQIQENFLSNVLVESSKVIKRFPDKLSIFLSPREPVAVSLTNINSLQKLIYLDRHGVFFKMADLELQNVGHILENYVILSGIENPQLNMQLPSSLISLLENIMSITSNAPELLSAISELKIEPKAWDGYELVIYPVHSNIKVRVESSLTEEVLRYMLLMLNVMDGNMQKPHEIDFRSGMGSYKNKEPYVW